MIRITQWEMKPHPTMGHMCLEGVVKSCKSGAPPGALVTIVDKTIRTSRITGFGACDQGVTVHTLSGQVYLLVGMSRPDMKQSARSILKVVTTVLQTNVNPSSAKDDEGLPAPEWETNEMGRVL